MNTLKRKAEPLSASTNDLKKPKKDSSLTSFFGVPKTTSSSTTPKDVLSGSGPTLEPPVANFDKDKWVESLKPDQRQLLKLEIDTLDPSWLAHLKADLVTPSFLELKRFLQREIDSGKKIFPPLEDVYSWSRHTPLNTVRAVILGQDPYHNHNQAHGLCFSVRPPTPAPPSLKNMYTALKQDYPAFKAPPNNGGLLTPWAEQGILMLNTCLTVRAHEAASHSNKGWEQFTQRVIDVVYKVRTRGVVFLAWGSPAQKRCVKIDGKRHIVLKSVHPSPLSAMRGFFDCGHFKKTNEWLESRYGADGQINWDLNRPKPIAAPKMNAAVKATDGQQKEPSEYGPTTELPEDNEGHKVTKQEEIKDGEEDEYEDDQDALDALEELANSSQMNPDGNPAEDKGKQGTSQDSDKMIS